MDYICIDKGLLSKGWFCICGLEMSVVNAMLRLDTMFGEELKYTLNICTISIMTQSTNKSPLYEQSIRNALRRNA